MGVRIGRTQRVTCALMLMIGLLLGTIAPTQEILAKSYDETTAIAVQEEVRVELQATNLQLADVETNTIEQNVFFEKAQTGIRWVIDDMPETERNLLEDQIKENDQMMDRDLQDNQEVNMQMIDEVEIITYGRVICQRLNFRKGPGIKYGIKKVLTRESVCEILSRTKSGWYKIKELSTGITGYVCGKYMKEIRETTALKKQKKQEKKIKAAQRDEKARRKAEKKLEEEASKHSYKGVQMQYSKRYNITKEPLTPIRGTKQFNGSKETWYSELVLDGGGLEIPGRHVAEDGTIRDKDGYICVAAHKGYRKYGTKLMTSRGPARVYDTGCAYGTIDVYTHWKRGQKVK